MLLINPTLLSRQANESERIKKDLEKFAAKVLQYKMESRKKTYFKYSTGPAAAYAELDQVAGEMLALRKECDHYFELASIFEFAQVCVHAACV